MRHLFLSDNSIKWEQCRFQLTYNDKLTVGTSCESSYDDSTSNGKYYKNTSFEAPQVAGITLPIANLYGQV